MENNLRQQFNIGPHSIFNQINILLTLETVWKNEKLCQALLPYKEQIMTQIMNIIESREKELNTNPKKLDKETLDILDLDLQRIKFYVKDYLRIRLAKIEKYLFHILKYNQGDLLSENEMKFCAELVNMKANYFNEGLKKLNVYVNNFRPFTDKFKTMSDKVSNLSESMIVKPNQNAYVLAESISDDNIVINVKDVYSEYTGDYVILSKGEAIMCPYELIKDSIINNKVKLL